MTSSVSGELMQVRVGAEGPQRRGSSGGRRGAKGTEKEAGLFVRSREREREMEGGLHGSAGGESERGGGFSRNAARARARTPGSLG